MSDAQTRHTGGRRRLAAWTVVGGVLVSAWILTPARVDVDAFSAWFSPHRYAWYALPGVVVAFVVLGLVFVPVVLLIAATGVAFGPWLGPIYAMAGSVASASVGFAIGRSLGLGRVEHIAGPRAVRMARSLERNGTLAVFFFRKIPLPFLLANVVAGASPVRYRDFLVGTVLGMAAVVIALAGFGSQIARLFDDPSLLSVLTAALVLAVPLTLAWLINRSVRRARYAA